MNMDKIIEIFEKVFNVFYDGSPINEISYELKIARYNFSKDKESFKDDIRIRVAHDYSSNKKTIDFILATQRHITTKKGSIKKVIKKEGIFESYDYEEIMSKNENEIELLFKTMSMEIKLSKEGYTI